MPAGFSSRQEMVNAFERDIEIAATNVHSNATT